LAWSLFAVLPVLRTPAGLLGPGFVLAVNLVIPVRITRHLKTFSVMVIEDDLVTSITLCKAIRVGIPDALVLTAHSLAEARLTLQEYTVNCFILDVNLPDGSGIDFIFDLTMKNPDANIVLMTNTPLPEYRDQAEAFGVLHFMAKPLDHKRLLAIVLEGRALPVAISKEENSLFNAALSRLTVLEIIQLKCLNNTTQAIDFKSARHGLGQVYFQNGEIIHAETALSKGMAALIEIVRWKGGHAEEVLDGSAAERTIMSSWQSTLLTAAQALDEP
jgi:ActR/RegA family two-component response regulator